MRYTMVGALMAIGVALIGVQTQSPDGYYPAGDVTHWEHASNAGSALIVVGGLVVASVVALTFLIDGVPSRRLGGLAAVGGGMVYVLAWVVAWVALMGGH
jgi:hypothetical protein